LLAGFGGLDHPLLLALCLVDGSVPHTLGGEDHGALLALRAHLLLHGGEHHDVAKRVAAAVSLLAIPLLDHVVWTRDGSFVSLRELDGTLLTAGRR